MREDEDMVGPSNCVSVKSILPPNRPPYFQNLSTYISDEISILITKVITDFHFIFIRFMDLMSNGVI